jgi:hypothetical protein
MAPGEVIRLYKINSSLLEMVDFNYSSVHKPLQIELCDK